MKIYILINNLGRGGAERVVQTLANHWSRQGAKVVIALLHNLPVDYHFAPEVEVISLTRSPNLSALARLLSLPILARRWARLLRDPEATHAFSLLPRANLVNCLSRRLGNPHPVIISEHSMTGLTYAGIGPVKMLMRLLIKLLYPQARTAIAVSTAVRNELSRIGFDLNHVRVVPNPQSITEIETQCRAKVDFPQFKDKPRLITVGRLLRMKDHDTLLKAFAHIRSRLDVQLVIAGDGPERPHLEETAHKMGLADDVWFTGWCDNPFAIMARCQIYMHSSRFESFGNALVEAMACGLPIASTACPGGISDIMQDAALQPQLVPVGDWRALAEKALALLQDPDHYAAVKAAGLRRARLFDVAAIAPLYEDCAALARQTTKKPAAA